MQKFIFYDNCFDGRINRVKISIFKDDKACQDYELYEAKTYECHPIKHYLLAHDEIIWVGLENGLLRPRLIS